MKEIQIVKHANAVNLARRLSAENENDLVQIDFYAEDEKPVSPRKFDHKYCEDLSHHLNRPNHLPEECMKFQDVVSILKRRETDTTHVTAGMS